MATANAVTANAVLGGGCFWCLEAVYVGLQGVNKVVSGYAGGQQDNPTYAQVCGGRTGHAEVVRITYDPAELSYADLLRVFFTIHDPTTVNRQGNDVGSQYRSIILTETPEQQEIAREICAEMEQSGIWGRKLVTEIVTLERFFSAESEHQDYFARHPYTGYCQAVVAPKVVKFRKLFAQRLKQAG